MDATEANENPTTPDEAQRLADKLRRAYRDFTADQKQADDVRTGEQDDNAKRRINEKAGRGYTEFLNAYDSFTDGIPDPTKVQVFAPLESTAAGSIGLSREPVSDIAGLILDKLRSLPEHKGMDTSALLSWLSQEHHKDIEDRTLRRYLNELKPYGLQNKAKIGYYIR